MGGGGEGGEAYETLQTLQCCHVKSLNKTETSDFVLCVFFVFKAIVKALFDARIGQNI